MLYTQGNVKDECGEPHNALEDTHVMNQSQSRYVERTNKRESNSHVHDSRWRTCWGMRKTQPIL